MTRLRDYGDTCNNPQTHHSLTQPHPRSGTRNSMFPELCSHHRRYRHLVAQMSPYPCMNSAGRCNCTINKKMLFDPLVDTEGTPDD